MRFVSCPESAKSHNAGKSVLAGHGNLCTVIYAMGAEGAGSANEPWISYPLIAVILRDRIRLDP